METSQDFDWTVILPDFERIKALLVYCINGVTGDPQSTLIFDTTIVTDIFTIVIFSLLFFFWLVYTIIALFYYFPIRSRNKKVQQLLNQSGNLIDSWDNVKQESTIFKTFDESLTVYNGKLYANQDVESFFSGKVLAPSLLQSKIFPFIAVFLTGLGVLGT